MLAISVNWVKGREEGGGVEVRTWLQIHDLPVNTQTNFRTYGIRASCVYIADGRLRCVIAYNTGQGGTICLF